MNIARPIALLGLVVSVGCTREDAPPPGAEQCDEEGDEKLVVIQRLSFVRQEDGVSDGFDLDGENSSLGSATGCGIADFATADGSPGVDNAFAYLLPALELTEAAAVEGLIQATIDSGELLIALELGELDDPLDDACVDVWVGRAGGSPLRGTDGRLLSGQTFDRDTESPSFVISDAALSGGQFEIPAEIRLPVTIFDVSLDFTLIGGRIRGTVLPDGTITGLFAGGLDIAYLLQITLEENVDNDLYGVLAALLGSWSDLAPGEDGLCQQISMTFAFDAVPAFWF